jgi:hypothetical protein
MPLEVWVGELLGPDPIESKQGEVVTLQPYGKPKEWAKLGAKGWAKLGAEWQEKPSYWHKGETGVWVEEKNPWYPAQVAGLKKLAHQFEKDISDYVKEDAESQP